MRKLFLCVLFIAACSGLLLAQSAQSDQPDQAQATSSTTTTTTTTMAPGSPLNGTVVSVDSKGNSITIMDPSTQKTTVYTFNKKTTFSRDNKPFVVSDLKQGDKVTFVSSDGTILSTVTIEPDSSTPPQK